MTATSSAELRADLERADAQLRELARAARVAPSLVGTPHHEAAVRAAQSRHDRARRRLPTAGGAGRSRRTARP